MEWVSKLFSFRQRRARREPSDVLRYDALAPDMRARIVQIWRDTIGLRWVYDTDPMYYHASVVRCGAIYMSVLKGLRRARGRFRLAETNDPEDPELELATYFLQEDNPEYTLDVVEAMFSVIEQALPSYRSEYLTFNGAELLPDQAIAELNRWFLEGGYGYRYESGQILLASSDYTHQAVVVPTLSLLRRQDYKGPEQEFLSAHNHYRHERYEECAVDCLKALESTMKVLIAKKGWKIRDRRGKTVPIDAATASILIQTCLDNGLLPTYHQQQLTSLRTLLASAVPAVRNKQGGHGQGGTVRTVPPHVAEFALNATAADILLLARAGES